MQKKIITKTRKGIQWSAAERIATQGIQLAITLLLARMLGPEAFGLVGMLAVFIAIVSVFVDGGFSSALIRKTDRSQRDFVTAFYYNILMSIFCYVILYFLAPYISEFYQRIELKQLLRVLGLVVVVNSITLIPRVQLTISMDFFTQAKISVFSVLVSGFAAIMLAIHGYGVWALVIQTLLNATCSTLLFNLFSPWRPTGKISKASFRYLFGFGSKLLLSGLIDVVYNNLYQIIIGKKFSPAIVGQFTQANQLASVPATTLTAVIQRVTFPMFSQLQDDIQRMTNAYRLTLRMSATLIFPLIAGLGLIAKPLLIGILGERWRTSADLLSVLCLGYMLYPIHAVNLNLLQVTGRSDLFLRVELIKKAIGLCLLTLSIPFGVFAMCANLTVYSYVSLFINTYYTAKLTSISQWQQCKDIFPIWMAVIVSCGIAYMSMSTLSVSVWMQALLGLIIALCCYVLYLYLIQRTLLVKIASVFRS